MTTDSSADELGAVSRAADAVEQASATRHLNIAPGLGFATIRLVFGSR